MAVVTKCLYINCGIHTQYIVIYKKYIEQAKCFKFSRTGLLTHKFKVETIHKLEP
jgi:hypothetical protein